MQMRKRYLQTRHHLLIICAQILAAIAILIYIPSSEEIDSKRERICASILESLQPHLRTKDADAVSKTLRAFCDEQASIVSIAIRVRNGTWLQEGLGVGEPVSATDASLSANERFFPIRSDDELIGIVFVAFHGTRLSHAARLWATCVIPVIFVAYFGTLRHYRLFSSKHLRVPGSPR